MHAAAQPSYDRAGPYAHAERDPAARRPIADSYTARLRMHAFQRQASPQTLAQGIDEYFAFNPGLARGRHMSPEAQHFFRCHDAVHVVFGCGTTLDDEAVVKIASMLGTTAGLGVLKGYRLHESLEIYRKLRVSAVLVSIAHSLIVIPRTVVRCLAQRSRWPWDGYEQHLETPLCELRRAFGIKVAHDRAA